VSTLTEIVEGLADQLRAIPALDNSVLTSVRRPGVFPAVVIQPPEIPDYGLALAGGGGEFIIPVLVVVGTAEAEKQQGLWPFIDWTGPSSIAVRIEANRDLGLGDVDARVISVADPGLVEFPDGTPAFGVTVNVQIIASP
jgi:hypothetical protein